MVPLRLVVLLFDPTMPAANGPEMADTVRPLLAGLPLPLVEELSYS